MLVLGYLDTLWIYSYTVPAAGEAASMRGTR